MRILTSLRSKNIPNAPLQNIKKQEENKPVVSQQPSRPIQPPQPAQQRPPPLINAPPPSAEDPSRYNINYIGKILPSQPKNLIRNWVGNLKMTRRGQSKMIRSDTIM